MVAAQSLQISAPEDALAGLGIVTDGIVRINIMFRVGVAGGRGLPVRVQGFTDLVVFHRLPHHQ